MEIIAVTDRKNCARPFLDQVRLICSAGADMVVMREKDLPYGESLALAASLMEICDGCGIEFCLDGDPRIAENLGIETVWMPFHSMEKKSRFRTIVSVHSFEEGIQASENGADAVVFGNVFETSCKPGKAAMGLGTVKRLASELRIPIWAIGGIGAGNIRAVSESGASGACLMSGLMAAEDPEEIISACRKECQSRRPMQYT